MFCSQSKILYSFIPDPSSGENLSFMFYEASLDSPLELEQIGEASPDKMPGRDMFLLQKDDGKLYAAVTNYDLAQESRLLSIWAIPPAILPPTMLT